MIRGRLFEAWLVWFAATVPAARPILLLDGHFAHIAHSVLMTAQQHQIDIFVLPAHTSHFLQPCDVGPYAVLTRVYEKQVSRFPLENKGELPTRDNVPAVVKCAWHDAFQGDVVRAGFRRSGIHPLSLDVMLKGIVGKDPVDVTTPYHSKLIPQTMTITARCKRKLEREGLNLDTLSVVSAHVQRFVEMGAARGQKRKGGTIIDEKEASKLHGCGFFITADGMVQLVAV